MANKIQFGTNRSNAFFLLFIIIGIIYSNSLTASWHLDDEPNIIQNNAIKINHLSFDSIQKSLYAHPRVNDRLYRPVAMLTFALNWWVGKNAVVGYHVVNIVIHLFCAFLLFLAIDTLFKSPNIKGRCDHNSHFIALLVCCILGDQSSPNPGSDLHCAANGLTFHVVLSFGTLSVP